MKSGWLKPLFYNKDIGKNRMAYDLLMCERDLRLLEQLPQFVFVVKRKTHLGKHHVSILRGVNRCSVCELNSSRFENALLKLSIVSLKRMLNLARIFYQEQIHLSTLYFRIFSI